MTAASPSRATVAEFVEFFGAGWAMGARDSEGFFNHFERRTRPDVRFSQPIVPTVQGPGALRQLFAPLFAAMPDLRGEVLRWGATDDGVIIELELCGTLGGKPLRWQVADRIILEDGCIRERRSYFDSLPLLRSLALRPRASLSLLIGLLRKA